MLVRLPKGAIYGHHWRSMDKVLQLFAIRSYHVYGVAWRAKEASDVLKYSRNSGQQPSKSLKIPNCRHKSTSTAFESANLSSDRTSVNESQLPKHHILEREIAHLATQLHTGKVANKILILTQTILLEHSLKFVDLTADTQQAVLISNSILGNHFEVVCLYEELEKVLEDPLQLCQTAEFYTAIIKSHLQSNRLKAAQKLLGRIPITATTPDMISRVISSFIKASDYASGMRIARRYADRGIVHTQRTYAYLYAGLTVIRHGESKDFKEMQKWFPASSEDSLEHLQYLCGAMVDVENFGEAKKIAEQMVEMWTEIKERTIEDDDRIIVAYSSLMRGVLKRAKYNSRVGSVEVILQINELFEELKQLGLQPNLYCYTSLMNAYYKYGGLQKVVGCFNQMLDAKIVPDQAIYNILIRAYTLENLTQNAMDLFDEMVLGRELYANFRVLTSVMAAVSLVGDMETCSKIFEQIEACGVKPDHALFHVMMSGYAQLSDIANVLTWYNHLLSAGLRPDTTTYTIVMYAISRSSDPEASRRWYDRVFSSNILPNVYTYSLLIHNRAKSGDLASAVHIYRDLVQTGIQPTSATFTMLINAHVVQHRAGNTSAETFQEAIELCHEMIRDAARPDVAVFHVMMKMFTSMGKVDQAVQLFERLKAGGIGGFGEMVEPDETMYMSAMVGYAALENLEKLEETLREMLVRGQVLGIKKYPPVMVMQTVLNKLSQMLWKRNSALEERVVALFERLVTEFLVDSPDGTPSIVMPTPDLFEKLIRATARNSKLGLSVMLYREMTRRAMADQLDPVTRGFLFDKLKTAANSPRSTLNSLLDAFGASVVSGTSLADSTFLNQALEFRRQGNLLTSINQVNDILIRLEDAVKFCLTPLSQEKWTQPSPRPTPGLHIGSLQHTYAKPKENWKIPSTTVNIFLECFNGTSIDPSPVWNRLVNHSCQPEINKLVLITYVEILSRLGLWNEIVVLLTVQSQKYGWMERYRGVEGKNSLLDEATTAMSRYGTMDVIALHEHTIRAFWASNTKK
ncbi:hypothetical protein BDR26DRAFT_872515, partial [Obelidium mucronatum]